MDKYKKIYGMNEALVSDELINSADSVITETILEAKPGMIIYNAGQSVIKQLSLDGKWVKIAFGGKDGADGKSAYDIAKEQNPAVGDVDTWLASLKGEPGADGKNGAAGKAGKDGKSVTAIALKTNADGKLTSGVVTFSDSSTAAITISVDE